MVGLADQDKFAVGLLSDDHDDLLNLLHTERKRLTWSDVQNSFERLSNVVPVAEKAFDVGCLLYHGPWLRPYRTLCSSHPGPKESLSGSQDPYPQCGPGKVLCRPRISGFLPLRVRRCRVFAERWLGNGYGGDADRLP